MSGPAPHAPPVLLTTPRLVLRRWRLASDLDEYATVCADPEVMHFIGDGSTHDRDRTQRAIDDYEAAWERNGFGLCAAVRRDTGELAGFVGLAVPEFLPEVMPSVEIGWRLGRRHWGLGLATEGARAVLRWAFAELGFDRIVSIHQVGNEASAAVMRKLGMTLDRTTVDPSVDRSVHVYAITRAGHDAHVARRARDAHRLALARFGVAVGRADALEAWDARTPCPDWSARDLVEHVIGFHEVLLLRPLGVRARRPRTGTVERWTATAASIERALDAVGGTPAGALVPVDPPRVDPALLPILTADVIVHAWDVERGIGGDEALPRDLVADSLSAVEPNADRLAASGLFAPAVSLPPDADLQARLLGLMGRDPFAP
jgi:uncharacterized protein (TIGR03086 family)